jgi:hypothetical protein
VIVYDVFRLSQLLTPNQKLHGGAVHAENGMTMVSWYAVTLLHVKLPGLGVAHVRLPNRSGSPDVGATITCSIRRGGCVEGARVDSGGTTRHGETNSEG